ncbi:MAG: hypothetical protein H6557_21120 [Lewinellaceae bacterium]|nr:hypothetical protein [Lewinellaceae bacterium]
MTWSAGLQATTIKLRPREAALSTGDSLLRQASAGEESSPVDFSGFSKSKGELEVAFRQAPQLNLMTLASRPAKTCFKQVFSKQLSFLVLPEAAFAGLEALTPVKVTK